MGWLRKTTALVAVFYALSAYSADPIVTESTTDSRVVTEGNMTTTVKSPPPSAISPQLTANGNSDLCTVGVAGAVQTQILGISMGSTVRDMNCEKLKNAKTLYDMGMKVAAVSVMCQDKRVFDAMMNAGTPCPYQGLIGDEAKTAWESAQLEQPEPEKVEGIDATKTWTIGGIVGALGWLLLL